MLFEEYVKIESTVIYFLRSKGNSKIPTRQDFLIDKISTEFPVTFSFFMEI